MQEKSLDLRRFTKTRTAENIENDRCLATGETSEQILIQKRPRMVRHSGQQAAVFARRPTGLKIPIHPCQKRKQRCCEHSRAASDKGLHIYRRQNNGSLDNIQQGRRNKRKFLLLVSKPAFLNASKSRCFAREPSESGGLPHRQSLAQA